MELKRNTTSRWLQVTYFNVILLEYVQYVIVHRAMNPDIGFVLNHNVLDDIVSVDGVEDICYRLGRIGSCAYE
jgi:hypothetical protein